MVSIQPGPQCGPVVAQTPDGKLMVSIVLAAPPTDAEVARLQKMAADPHFTVQFAHQPMVGMMRDARGRWAGALRARLKAPVIVESIMARLMKVEPELDANKVRAELSEMSQRELVALDYLGNPFAPQSEEDVLSELDFSPGAKQRMLSNPKWLWARQKLNDYHIGSDLRPALLDVVAREIQDVKLKKSPRDQVTTLCIKIGSIVASLGERVPIPVRQEMMRQLSETRQSEQPADLVSALARASRVLEAAEKAEAEKKMSRLSVAEDGELRLGGN